MNYKQLRNCIFTLAILLSVSSYGWAAGFSQFSPPQNMGSNINSAGMDQGPAPAPNGLSLYFTSTLATSGGQGGNDIWVSQRASTAGAWGPLQNLGTTLNTSSNDTVNAISPNGLEMLITSNRPGGSGGPDLYISTRTDPNNDFGWTTPYNLGPAINSAAQDIGSAFFVDTAGDQKLLFFTSDRAETGLGNIYQSYFDPNSTNYMPPVLINELNSPAAERSITISRDGLEAFISSTRLSSTNVVSIFLSTRASISAPWNRPVPAGILNAGGNASQPAFSPDGTVLYFVSSRTGTLGLGDLYSSTRVSVNRTSTADFDGDGQTDFSVFRPSDGTWYLLESGSNTFRARQFGMSGDKIVPGDYDGDGRTDMAVYRPDPAQPGNLWYILRSSDSSYFITVPWGISTDTPVPGDYDGDGRTDVAVYRGGVWYIVQSSNGNLTTRDYGSAGDIPVAGANAQ